MTVVVEVLFEVSWVGIVRGWQWTRTSRGSSAAFIFSPHPTHDQFISSVWSRPLLFQPNAYVWETPYLRSRPFRYSTITTGCICLRRLAVATMYAPFPGGDDGAETSWTGSLTAQVDHCNIPSSNRLRELVHNMASCSWIARCVSVVVKKVLFCSTVTSPLDTVE